MSACTICGHAEHNRRCTYPTTEEIRDNLVSAAIITRHVVVGQCACGFVDSLMADLGIEDL
jgi:hypothetical protein